jgi:hypothetical protein
MIIQSTSQEMKVFFSIETVEGGSKFCKGSTILGVGMRRRKSADYFANIDTPTDEDHLNQEEVPETADQKNGLIDDNSINESRNEGIFLNRDCRGREGEVLQGQYEFGS